MKHVHSIDIVFENCERITLDAGDIGFIAIGAVKPFIKRVGCNSILEMNIVEEVAFELFSSCISRLYNPFGLSNQYKIIRERLLEHNDITQLVIHYEDNSSAEFYVNWNGDMENNYQKSIVGKNGNFYLVISEYKNIIDYFPSEITDDVEKATVVSAIIRQAHRKVN